MIGTKRRAGLASRDVLRWPGVAFADSGKGRRHTSILDEMSALNRKRSWRVGASKCEVTDANNFP
jgi:hypothetical protein